MKSKFAQLLLFCFFSCTFAQAQVQNADSLFEQVRLIAAAGNYQEALGQINHLRTNYPQNADYTLYAARLYYWSGYMDEAYDLVDGILLNAENKNEEAFKLRSSIALASRKYETLLEQSAKGIQWYPDDHLFYSLLQAQALEKLGRDHAALALLDTIADDSEKYQDAQYLKTGILQKKTNSVSLGYLFTGFTNPRFDPWHFAHFQYMAKTPKSAYVGRLNFGAPFGKAAVQAEFDAYPKITPKSYLYLNAGFSDGVIFPLIRLGAEYYGERKIFGSSLGFRYLHFKTSQVLLLTGHLALNIDAFKISYRPYLLPQGNKWYTSHVVNLRQSFENKEAYVQLDFQYGVIPYYYFASNDFTRTSAYRVGVDFKFRITNHFFMQPVLMYELEEFLPGTTRNRYNLQIIFSKRF